jgi:hypothetical protein
MNCLTIKRGDDGFGSQLFSIISGICYSERNKVKYLHSKINNIKLVDKDSFQNDEIEISNDLINNIINKMGFDLHQGENCTVLPFLHDIIFDEGVDGYFTDEVLDKFKKSYTNLKPKTYNNNFTNIAIHIRRGDDILEWDKSVRWIDSNIYDNLILKLNNKIKNPHFHIFSWGNPNLSVSIPNITYHTVYSGEKFIEHFNHLVHSDILVVGSSTFSISAGFFNSNTVICHQSLCKLGKTPIPNQWINNYNKLINI